MKNEIKKATSKETNVNRYKITTLVLGLLFVSALATSLWLLSERNNHANYATELSDQVNGLNESKGELETNLLDLKNEFDIQIESIDSLELTVADKLEEIDLLKKKVYQAKKQLAESKTNADQIQSRLTQLEELKTALERDIQALAVENGGLKEMNETLQISLASTVQEVEELNYEITVMTKENQKLQHRLYTIAPAGYTAENFTIIAEQRNDKMTTKARKADEIKVSFDIDDVPLNYQGKREIYLVLTEFNGNVVSQVPSKKVSIKMNDNPINVSAADIETVNLTDRQSFTMSFKPQDNLEPGTYNLLVYADNGFLGSTGLRLR